MTPPATASLSRIDSPPRLLLQTAPACDHDGFYTGTTRYHTHSKLLRFLLVCDSCGREMREIERVSYEPQYVAEPPEAVDVAA